MTTSTRRIAARFVTLVVMASALGLGAGCSTVAPYERGKLAHPTMSVASMDTFGSAHLKAISEGATGGSAGSGSGCGCN